MEDKRSTKSVIVIVVLNLFLLSIFSLSALSYDDVSKFAASGGDPLGLIFVPIMFLPLIVLGIILIGFKIRLQIPLINGLIPFIGILGLIIPLLINGSTPVGQGSAVHDYWTRVGLEGVGVCVALVLMTAILTVVTLIPKRTAG